VNSKLTGVRAGGGLVPRSGVVPWSGGISSGVAGSRVSGGLLRVQAKEGLSDNVVVQNLGTLVDKVEEQLI
jgi:hypothetical protein